MTLEEGADTPPAQPEHGHSTLGISFSGGGIRSAAFCLGAYQALSQMGLFQCAKYLSGVSGGSYIAAALAVAHGASDEAALRGKTPPWSRGSAEERYLRTHLSYLAPGLGGRLWLAANFLYGFVLNLLPLILGSYLAGRLLGHVYGWLGLSPHLGLEHTWAGLRWGALIGGLLLLASMVLVGVRRFFDKDRFDHLLAPRLLKIGAMVTFGGALAVFLVFVVLPLLIIELGFFLEGVSSLLGLRVDETVQRFAASVILTGVAIVVSALAVLLMQAGVLRSLQGLLAFVGGWGMLAVPFLMAAERSTRRGWTWETDLPVFGLGLAVLIFSGLFSHNRRYSMHLYYRERLSRAFVLRRESDPSGFEVKAVPYDTPVRLSELGQRIDSMRTRGVAFPELVICAAIAARDGDVPNRSYAASFTFDSKRSGSPDLGLTADTRAVEKAHTVGESDLTLPSMMAISGAAISPTMGRFTLPSLRLIMALLNLRLGVWIPNLFKDVGPPTAESRSGLLQTLRDGWREPGALYVMREATGLAGAKGDFVHVSDGGHWENLGLVELIRRRCTHIVVVDASASGRSPLQDIGRAAALARAELRAEIQLDPTATVPSAPDALADSPFAIGRVLYEDGSVGIIYYARCVLWKGAPMDLKVYRHSDPRFPRHPTANQLFSGEQFDAYRALGWSAAQELSSLGNIPIEQLRTGLAGRGADDEPRGVLIMD